MHVVTDEVARLREALGDRAEDEMFAESSPRLSEAARAYVIEIRAARALVLAALKQSKRERDRCLLCGSLALSLYFTRGARTCEECGATTHDASAATDTYALWLEDNIARVGERV